MSLTKATRTDHGRDTAACQQKQRPDELMFRLANERDGEMAFLRNTWYCAGWSEEVADAPLARTILNEPILMFRDAGGNLSAIADRCPHRFAPLHKGKFADGVIECPYHGLKFDGTGVCVHNPQGDGLIPKAAVVATYPVEERQGTIWIWMGERAAADPSKIVDIAAVFERSDWTLIRSYIHVEVNYELVTDNLLDLSHAHYIHPYLTYDHRPDDFAEKRWMTNDGDVIWSMQERHGQPVPGIFKFLWGAGAPSTGCQRAHMRWSPPCVLFLDLGMWPTNGSEQDGPSAPVAHILTPETETTTHYFWAMARSTLLGDREVDAKLIKSFNDIFALEDAAMISACQERMGTTELFSLKPVLLAGDAPAVRARRILERLISKETAVAASG